MGFMDKLKNAGKKAAFGAVLASTKKYGTVIGGKYKGCQVATDASGEILLFIMVAKENGRHTIKEDIQRMELVDADGKGTSFNLTLYFKNGDESTIYLVKNESQGSALPTASQRVAAQFNHIAEFLFKLVDKIEFSEESKAVVNLIMRYTNNKQLD